MSETVVLLQLNALYRLYCHQKCVMHPPAFDSIEMTWVAGLGNALRGSLEQRPEALGEEEVGEVVDLRGERGRCIDECTCPVITLH